MTTRAPSTTVDDPIARTRATLPAGLNDEQQNALLLASIAINAVLGTDPDARAFLAELAPDLFGPWAVPTPTDPTIQ